MEAYIGCSGWFYWHWRGRFYPDTQRTDTWFRHYTDNFRTVELNAPFYSWPKLATVKTWARNAIEFRHQSWWRESVYRRFQECGLIFCSVSAPRLPDDLIKTNEVIYARLHGRNRWYRHDYAAEEIADWASKIEESGARQAWIYFDNDRDAFAIKNAHELGRQLRERGVAVV